MKKGRRRRASLMLLCRDGYDMPSTWARETDIALAIIVLVVSLQSYDYDNLLPAYLLDCWLDIPPQAGL